MKNIKLWAGLLVLFFSGVLVGSFGTGLYLKNRVNRFMRGGHGLRNQLIVDKYAADLDLNESQLVKIKSIIEQTETEIFQIQEKNRPELETIINNRTQQMKEVLTAPQQKKLDEIHEMIQRRHRHQRGRQRKFKMHQQGRPGKPDLMPSLRGVPAGRDLMILAREMDKLDLSQEQRAAIEKTLQETEVELSTIRKKIEPEIEAVINQKMELLTPLLSSEQMQKFSRIKERFGKHRNSSECDKPM
ncbi:hypothetical protein ACFL27_00680 [candidate division CSSED10-310 bacterium]|uniref:Periplasmic heavy metal sensor n=1 Tax=candidate division CSSED10-310 bacterium TaxID=2855610 RepID=A0ABV6YR60_UNCC1